MFNLLFLILGFFPLICGANFLVDGASSIAKKFNIPNIVIGLTIVAFGTSSPELIVNIFASIAGNTEITLGNIIGSNIFNILGILGITAIIYPLVVKTNTTWIEIPLCLLSASLVIVIANDVIIDKASASAITRIDGIILLSFFFIFLIYTFIMMKSGVYEEEITVKQRSLINCAVLVILGLFFLVIGGKIIVEYAIRLARSVGVSERLIALTIVAIGTSLPELATSTVAARKKNVDIAIGNIVGSNIFNIFFILGLSAIINPVPLQKASNIDLLVNIFSSVMLFAFIFTGKGRKIERWEGILFLIFYVGYIALLLFIKIV